MQIAPSLLSADAARLGEEVEAIELARADMLHIDVMDGHFVPNLSFGPGIVSALRKRTGLFFDVHLMLAHPAAYVRAFLDAGADAITAHLECGDDELAEVQAACRERDVGFGISLCPETPVDSVEKWLPELSILLIMSIHPGFGGQRFMPEALTRIEQVKALRDRVSPGCLISVDGGVNADNAGLCVAAGADILVAGSAVFGAADRADAIMRLRQAGANV